MNSQKELEQEKTPFDYLIAEINGYTLRDAYLLGRKHEKKQDEEFRQVIEKKLAGRGNRPLPRNKGR